MRLAISFVENATDVTFSLIELMKTFVYVDVSNIKVKFIFLEYILTTKLLTSGHFLSIF